MISYGVIQTAPSDAISSTAGILHVSKLGLLRLRWRWPRSGNEFQEICGCPSGRCEYWKLWKLVRKNGKTLQICKTKFRFPKRQSAIHLTPYISLCEIKIWLKSMKSNKNKVPVALAPSCLKFFLVWRKTCRPHFSWKVRKTLIP